MRSDTIERVLLAVESIPAGSVATYGDVGQLAGVGPRQVGAVLSRHGAGVAWWRVVSAAGVLPPHLFAEARCHWDAEGVCHRGGRVDLRAHRIDV